MHGAGAGPGVSFTCSVNGWLLDAPSNPLTWMRNESPWSVLRTTVLADSVVVPRWMLELRSGAAIVGTSESCCGIACVLSTAPSSVLSGGAELRSGDERNGDERNGACGVSFAPGP